MTETVANPFEGLPCGECGRTELKLEYRLQVKPLGTFSLAGAVLKASAYPWPFCVCVACGAECEGKG